MSEHTSEVLPAKVRAPRRISPFWLLPLIAFLIGGLLFLQILREQGEEITIRFQGGAGISAGKTAIRFQGLQIGVVKKVNFSNDMREVEATAEINPEAKKVLRKDTKFWLVSPTASLAGVSGLDALVSGNYITLLPGESNDSEDEFVAESEPPVVPISDGDLLIKLLANDLGSIGVGASVYFRKVPVGTVSDFRFTNDQKKVEIDVLINKKYAHFVKKESRFWNISGVRANFNLSQGVSVEMDSLLSMVQGAVAFDSPSQSEVANQAQPFHLYKDFKAARRGVEVSVDVPFTVGIEANETEVFYQGVKIGVLTKIESPFESELKQEKGMLKGELLIDLNYQNLLRKNSVILLKKPKLAFNKNQLDRLNEILRGNYFELIEGDGEISHHFVVQRGEDYLSTHPDALSFTLVSEQSYGVDQGQGVYYNDVQIGEILKREINPDEVQFTVMIFPEFSQFIGANSQFIPISHLDVSLGVEGVNMNVSSPTQWVLGGVRLLNGKASGKPNKRYPLYKNEENAANGIISSERKATLTLAATDLSGIAKGSVLLYRNFQVGEVLNVRPQKSRFDVDLFVEPKYRHLLSDNSRFWIEPAVQVEVSPRGVSLQASPLMRSLKGAISFDNSGAKNNRILYASFDKARSGNTYLTLTAKEASQLSQGMPIKYMGLNVGKVEELKLENSKKQVSITAFIDGQYFPLLAKAGAKFRVISPEVSTSGVKNLDAALQNYISVELGSGERQTQFTLIEKENSVSQFANGFPIIVETTDANGIMPDAPVLFRGMQVGAVQRLSLSELGDRVLVHIAINPKYRHLVRKNSQFWAASGYTMDISLSGASLNSGTLSQLLNGGIAFSNPSGNVVAQQAQANHRFRLQRKTPEGALGWDQGAAE